MKNKKSLIATISTVALLSALFFFQSSDWTGEIPTSNSTNNDIVLTGTQVNYTVPQSGTASNPVVVYGINATCVNVDKNYVILVAPRSVGCTGHGILITGKYVSVLDGYVKNAESDYLRVDKLGCTQTDQQQWGSGLKVMVGGENILLRGNTVIENCGEGIAVTRGVNVIVENNYVRDNFSVNIYIDNSKNVIVRNNESVCTGIFLRNNKRAGGIVTGEEYYAGWGAQRNNTFIENNYVTGCHNGFSSSLTEPEIRDVGGERNLTLVNNVFENTTGNVSIFLQARNENVVLCNNTRDKSLYISYPAGVIQSCAPLTGTPNVTPVTSTPTNVTNTPTFTITPTRTPTRTVTVSPTFTHTPTSTLPSAKPTVLWECVVTPLVKIECKVKP